MPSGPKNVGSAPYWSAVTCVAGCEDASSRSVYCTPSLAADQKVTVAYGATPHTPSAGCTTKSPIPAPYSYRATRHHLI
jgi:hypothetical protein